MEFVAVEEARPKGSNVAVDPYGPTDEGLKLPG
jgi:hypothetical protein